jgi:hypothetical protein
MQGPFLEQELAHWKKVLEDAPAEVALPLDHLRQERPSGRAGTRALRCDAASVQKMMDFARREGLHAVHDPLECLDDHTAKVDGAT